MRIPSKQNLLFLLILLLFVGNAALFIFRASFIIKGERYFTLFDDEMVSMRYARNLAHGYGLVWNPGGERVEGYTNPLWVLYMAAWHLLPISISKISLAIQLSGLAFLAANLYFVRKIAATLSGGAMAVWVGAALLTAFYLPLNNWSLTGNEVSVLTLLICIAAWQGLQVLDGKRVSPLLYILLGIGTLVRMDMAVVFLAIMAFLAFADRKDRRRHLLYGLVSLTFFIALQTILRWIYYGDWLPNTYYLKVTGYPFLPRMIHGAYEFLLFVANMNPLLFIAPFAITRAITDHRLRFLWVIFLSQVAYSIYVGGDAWEAWVGSNRYISVVMPIFIILLCYSFWKLLTEVSSDLANGSIGDKETLRVMNLSVLLVLLCVTTLLSYPGLVTTSFGWGIVLGGGLALSLAVGAVLLRLRARIISRHNTAEMPPAKYHTTGWAPFGVSALALFSLVNLNVVYFPSPNDPAVWSPLRSPVQTWENREKIEQALSLRKATMPDAKLAVVWAGIVPYFSERPAVDLLGKSDRTIAHELMKRTPGADLLTEFYPGHMKWDYSRSIGQLKPDVIVQLWPLVGSVPSDAKLYLDASYIPVKIEGYGVYVRKGSPSIRWNLIPNVGSTR